MRSRLLLVVVALLVLAAWTAWPRGAEPPLPPAAEPAAAAAPAPAATPVAVAAAPAIAEAPASLPAPPAEPRAAVAPGPARLRVLAAVGTPGFGFVRLLHRPDFAPRVRFDAELWKAFAEGPRGDLAALADVVFDRLARLGYQSVAERPWRDAQPLEVEAEAVGEATLAVALNARAVGHARLDPGGCVDVKTVGAAELRTDGRGELWVWSDSAFVGPHRAGSGRPVPAARTCAVQIERSPDLSVRFFPAVWALAGRTEHLTTVPQVADRRLRVGGALFLSPGPPPVANDHVLLALAEPEAPATLTVHEEGEPWGCYVEQTDGETPRVLARATR